MHCHGCFTAGIGRGKTYSILQPFCFFANFASEMRCLSATAKKKSHPSLVRSFTKITTTFVICSYYNYRKIKFFLFLRVNSTAVLLHVARVFWTIDCFIAERVLQRRELDCWEREAFTTTSLSSLTTTATTAAATTTTKGTAVCHPIV